MQDGCQILLDMEMSYSLSCFYTDFRRYCTGLVGDRCLKARFHKTEDYAGKFILFYCCLYIKTRHSKVSNIPVSKIDSGWQLAKCGISHASESMIL